MKLRVCGKLEDLIENLRNNVTDEGIINSMYAQIAIPLNYETRKGFGSFDEWFSYLRDQRAVVVDSDHSQGDGSRKGMYEKGKPVSDLGRAVTGDKDVIISLGDFIKRLRINGVRDEEFDRIFLRMKAYVAGDDDEAAGETAVSDERCYRN